MVRRKVLPASAFG